MSFKSVYSIIICGLLFMLAACGDADKEKDLVDLFTTADQDLVAINFPAATTQDLISVDTFVDYSIEGLKSNGVDVVSVNDNVRWSLSAGAVSRIDETGRLNSGSVAEVVTITAELGVLTATQVVTVSAAKFDRVIKLDDAPVTINMCQSRQIQPVGSYLNDDGSEEIRPVDNTVINTITWLVKNQEDGAPSQRAYIKTENNLIELQALEAGNVIIQARAKSLSSGNIVSSVDFDQTLDNNINSIKLCLKSETDLAGCAVSSVDIVENAEASFMAVANYQAADGSSYYQNISAYSKWGNDNTSNATIAFSADRQQLDVIGNAPASTANISVACGNIEQTVSDEEIKNGVVLAQPVTCVGGNINCLRTVAAVNITSKIVTSLTVTANNAALVDNTALVLATRPPTIMLDVTANFSDNTSQNVTTDTNTIYNNQSGLVVIAITGSPGEYNVLIAGDAEIQVIFQGKVFVVKMIIP